MFHKIKKVETLSNKMLKVEFENNKIKYYNMKNIIEKIKEFEILNNENIFNNARVDKGGYAVIWNDDLDIDCEELYQKGVDDL